MSKLISPILEACVETLEEAIQAEQNGANQLELCADLANDGLSPEIGLVKQIVQRVKIPVKVMLRPRAGNFIYNDGEFARMLGILKLFKKEKIAGIVTGILTDNSTLDLARIEKICCKSAPLPVTIHKCIDKTAHPFHELEKLKGIKGVSSILSSGGEGNAEDNVDLLKAIWRWGYGRFDLIVAGKVTKTNLADIHQKIGASYYHGRRIVS